MPVRAAETGPPAAPRLNQPTAAASTHHALPPVLLNPTVRPDAARRFTGNRSRPSARSDYATFQRPVPDVPCELRSSAPRSPLRRLQLRARSLSLPSTSTASDASKGEPVSTATPAFIETDLTRSRGKPPSRYHPTRSRDANTVRRPEEEQRPRHPTSQDRTVSRPVACNPGSPAHAHSRQSLPTARCSVGTPVTHSSKPSSVARH